jgi:hypothetical protein
VRAKAFAAIAAASVIAALLLPAGAGAAPARGRHDRVVEASISLPGTNGYLIDVTLMNRSRLKITALPEREQLLEHLFEFASTEYRLDAPQPRGSNRIRASLGRFGSIDLRFKPVEADERSAALLGCKGDTMKTEVGWFTGLISFRGERGYTRARAHKVFGTVINVPRPGRKCHSMAGKKPQERSPEHRARTAMLAMSKRAKESGAHLLGLATKKVAGNRKIGFAALRLSATHKGKEAALDTFVGTAIRDRGRIQEQGTAFALLAIGPYFKVPDLDHMTSEAVLAPPKPFLGSATFQRESADAVSWAGDLRAKLPGFGAVPFTGNGFKTVMCEDAGCRPDK